MPKANRILTSEFPYFVTARSRNQEWYQLDMDLVWEIFSDYAFFINRAYGVNIYAFVLMYNHFHTLLQTPDANLDVVMNYFMREISRVIGQHSGRINQIFGGPYHSSLIKTESHLNNVIKYLYRNPIEAGVCKKAELYKYSSLNGLIGENYMIIPLDPKYQFGTFGDFSEFLKFVNRDYKNDDGERIKKGLRRSDFKPSRSDRSGKIKIDQ